MRTSCIQWGVISQPNAEGPGLTDIERDPMPIGDLIYIAKDPPVPQ